MRNVLEVREIHLSFGGIKAIDGASLQLRKGEILALVGPNGSGKTSLLNCICGFYKPEKGRIIYNGKDITKTPPHVRAEMGIGRTFQTPYIFHGTVLDNIVVGYVTKNNNPMSLLTFKSTVEARKIAEELIDFVELPKFGVDRYAPAVGLSMGIWKRIELARVLMWNPDTLLLDEPTSGLSIDEKRDMARFILELNEVYEKNILLVEHDLSLVNDIAHRTVVMDSGIVIAEGTPEEIVEDPKVIKAYLGE